MAGGVQGGGRTENILPVLSSGLSRPSGNNKALLEFLRRGCFFTPQFLNADCYKVSAFNLRIARHVPRRMVFIIWRHVANRIMI